VQPLARRSRNLVQHHRLSFAHAWACRPHGRTANVDPNILAFAWNSEHVFEACGLRISPRETTHLQSLWQKFGIGRFKSYSLLVERPNFRIVFSGDLGSPTDLGIQLTNPVDLLVSELAHFPPSELFRFLHSHKVGKLLLTHLAPELRGQEESILEEARSALPETEVLIANDGLRVDVGKASRLTQA